MVCPRCAALARSARRRQRLLGSALIASLVLAVGWLALEAWHEHRDNPYGDHAAQVKKSRARVDTQPCDLDELGYLVTQYMHAGARDEAKRVLERSLRVCEHWNDFRHRSVPLVVWVGSHREAVEAERDRYWAEEVPWLFPDDPAAR
jgi:hypothetical protein